MKFDCSALTVIVVSVAGSWTGLSVKYDRKLAMLSDKIETCACSKEEADPTSTLLSQVAEATKLSTQSLETSERIERRLNAETDNKISNQDSPFTKDGDWWVSAEGTMFLIPGGIVIGSRNEDCAYGQGVLSVDNGYEPGNNCPSGDGSVTFGHNNKASGELATVTGGSYNVASGNRASITGGSDNIAEGGWCAVFGGSRNKAKVQLSTVSGGEYNVAAAEYGSIFGGYGNNASGFRATVSGGNRNQASGREATVSGGSLNQASGDKASVSGGFRNTSDGKFASVLGGKKKAASKNFGIFPK